MNINAKILISSNVPSKPRLIGYLAKPKKLHRQGSISTIEVVVQMASRSNGVLPTAADVYEKTHSVNVGESETDLIGERANKIMEEYNEKLENYQEKGIEKDPNDVY